MSYTDQTLKKLFALSGNVCAFPGSPAPIMDTDMDVVVGDICHIKGKSKNGPRYDPDQSESERNGYENLLVRDIPYQHKADAVKQAFWLVELCAKSFQRAARQLANIRLVRAKTARARRRDRFKTLKPVNNVA